MEMKKLPTKSGVFYCQMQSEPKGRIVPLIPFESSAQMRNEGGGFAANIYVSMPEGFLITGFLF